MNNKNGVLKSVNIFLKPSMYMDGEGLRHGSL